MARALRLLAALALAGVVLVATVGPSDATRGPRPQSGGGDTAARPGTVHAQITFSKSRAHPWDSTISWDAWRQGADGKWRVVAHQAWRAGSGFPGAATENPCAKNRGWLPNGRYSVRQVENYPGSLIRGRVFRLSDKRCPDGTLRQELFIHTETGPGNHQCADGPGDQICRWEFPKINDYTSHGCIKMSPASILALTRAYHRFFRAGLRYPTTRVRLVVR